jgi:hypothetical protein
MSLLNLALGRLHLVPPFENVARRLLYLAFLLLPGSIIALPLLWWLDRRQASPRGRAGNVPRCQNASPWNVIVRRNPCRKATEEKPCNTC